MVGLVNGGKPLLLAKLLDSLILIPLRTLLHSNLLDFAESKIQFQKTKKITT
jgi:hypothetical protein